MTRQIRPWRVVDSAGILRDRRFIRGSIGPNNQLIVLSTDKSSSYHVHFNIGSGWELGVTVPPTSYRYHFAQPLGDHWLLAEPRQASRTVTNADVFDRQGAKQAALKLGDGIADIQTTSDERIWISYFDEGVYGGGETEHSGLACLDSGGVVKFRYWEDAAEPHRLPPIDDCYALNVVSEREVWTTYYSAFPVVKLQDYALSDKWLDFPNRASRAFAVLKNRLVLAPAYNKDEPPVLVDLDRQTLEELEAVDKTGKRLTMEYVFARGRFICVAPRGIEDPSSFYVFNMAEFA